MKTNFINQKLSRLSHPKLNAAIALACGFWVSQFLTWAFVGTILGALPSAVAFLPFGALVIFSLMRLPHMRSRLPAILGLCSSGLLLFLYAYLSYFSPGSLVITELYLLLAFGLAVAGVVIDAKRCWRWVSNAGGIYGTLNASPTL